MELARRAWTDFEPIHAVVYFAPEAAEEYGAAGLKGGWMGYFGSRAAPMGEVTAAVVTATFHNFAPRLVERAIPDAWRYAGRDAILAARLRVADRTLRRLWGDGAPDDPDVREAAERLGAVTATLNAGGRPIFAGHAALPVPEVPHLALWHHCTLLREHRFDGHVAALVGYGLSGLESYLVAHAAEGYDAERVRQTRGWSPEESAAVFAGLQERGLLDGDGHVTDAGRRLHEAVERVTDLAASAPWTALPGSDAERVLTLLHDLARRLAGAIPFPNPIGLPPPA